MKNIFVAIGGSGTKVADALVRLLTVGFPITRDREVLTSAGGTMEFWVVDPDIDSAARSELSKSIAEYHELTRLIGDKWSVQIQEDSPKVFNPLNLPGVNNQGKTLRTLLSAGGTSPTEPFLHLFYKPEELDIEINRGFYQKPFIGAAVMAMFADSLTKGREHGGAQDTFNQLKNEEVRFFVCGSLHGGTGASGVPVIGEFLKETKGTAEKKANWRVGACLLAPYCLPIGPPFDPLKEGEPIDKALIELKASFFDEKNKASDPYRAAYEKLGEPEREQLIRQILLGFFARPDEIRARAHQAILYYQNNVIKQKGSDSGAVFDDIYVVGKPQPTQLKTWSNGGKSQLNPLDSAEVAAALTSLNFFAGSSVDGGNDYVVAASTSCDSTEGLQDRLQQMHLYDLPSYGNDKIDAERVFLATAFLVHFLQYEIPWNIPAKRWSGLEHLRSQYLDRNGEDRKQSDAGAYNEAGRLMIKSLKSLVDPAMTIGWHPSVVNSLERLVSEESVEKMEKRGSFENYPKGSLDLGRSSVIATALDVGKWYPEAQVQPVSRGEYMRCIWDEAYKRVKSSNS
jgi:hypothetical protein